MRKGGGAEERGRGNPAPEGVYSIVRGPARVFDQGEKMFGLFRGTPDDPANDITAPDGKRTEVLTDPHGRLRSQTRRRSTGNDLFEGLTASTVAIGLTPSKYAGATGAVISVEDANIRFRVDGVAATSAFGHVVFDGDFIYLTSADEIEKFSAVRNNAVDAVLMITYTKAD